MVERHYYSFERLEGQKNERGEGAGGKHIRMYTL